jgi:hypothetical protein
MRVLPAQPPRWLNGTAEIARRTRARVSWKFAALGGVTQVRLDAAVKRPARSSACCSSSAGRWWLRRRFAATLARLAERLSAAPRVVSSATAMQSARPGRRRPGPTGEAGDG